MPLYHFVNVWRFQVPPERVWAALLEMRAWPAWWPSWRRADFHGAELRLGLNSRVDHEVRGPWPYSLRFSTRVTRLEAPRLIEVQATGQLVGRGRFVLAPQPPLGVEVTCIWEVATASPLLDRLGRIRPVRALLERNHGWIMDEGWRGLRRRLES